MEIDGHDKTHDEKSTFWSINLPSVDSFDLRFPYILSNQVEGGMTTTVQCCLSFIQQLNKNLFPLICEKKFHSLSPYLHSSRCLTAKIKMSPFIKIFLLQLQLLLMLVLPLLSVSHFPEAARSLSFQIFRHDHCHSRERRCFTSVTAEATPPRDAQQKLLFIIAAGALSSLCSVHCHTECRPSVSDNVKLVTAIPSTEQLFLLKPTHPVFGHVTATVHSPGWLAVWLACCLVG